MKRVLVLGAGGHAQVVVDILFRMRDAGKPIEPIGYLDDDKTLSGRSFLELPVLGTTEDLENVVHDAIIIGIGDNQIRQRLFEALQKKGEQFIVARHPGATIAPDVSLGPGSVICAQVVVNPGSVIGANVILNTGCTVDHHNHIANHVHIAPGVHLGGDVVVEEGVLVGLGAVVMPQNRIGMSSVVGAGALVNKSLPDHVTAVGVPAHIIKNHDNGIPKQRIYLSPPHMSGEEQAFVQNAFETNWIAPLGPHVDAFENEFCEVVQAKNAVALSSGTAALHLALLLCGVEAGDEVLVSSLTFSASVNPIVYVGAKPVFVDSEPGSWNMDPALLAEIVERKARNGRVPKAVVLVHLYGQTGNIDAILEICQAYNIVLIEDAAEALGATYKGRSPGVWGKAGIFSFNGNKIITTSGGGMLVSDDADIIVHARKLATQAREPKPHYEHMEIGYNYRMSNVLAGIGRGQLMVLEDRVQSKRRNFDFYEAALSDLPGIQFMPEASWGRHTRWLTTLTIDPKQSGIDRERVRLALEAQNIEARPVWKPMHLQPVFSGYECVGGAVAEKLFNDGLCLPSGSNLTKADLSRIVAVIRDLFG